MKINRNNYETFFLLYVDNELSSSERSSVESFVAQYPDLKNELDQLCSLVLPADEFVFVDKNELLRSESVGEVSEEKLLLHLDNELSGLEAEDMDKMIEQNETLKTDWLILQQTKLDKGEKIIFADKHLLYHKERDNVIAGRFVRWAVAAILIGFGLYFGISVSTKNDLDDVIAVAKNSNTNATTPDIAKKEQKIITGVQQVLSSEENNTAAGLAESKTFQKKTGSMPVDHSNKKLPENSQTKQEYTLNEPDLQNNKAIVPVLTNNNPVITLEKTDPERTAKETAAVLSRQNPVATDNEPEVSQKNILASIADKGEDATGDRILYVKEQTVSRTKVGGLFKRLKNAVEKGSNIKIGKSIKIANFEIALN